MAALTWILALSPVYSHNPITTTVLFNREVIKIFQQKCLQCHNEGAMAMPLRTYEEARPWAVAIKEAVLARRMPPWPAERGYGDYANDIGLTNREIDFLISWVEGGVPSGSDKPPEYVDHSSHWMLGPPDFERTPAGTVILSAGNQPVWKRFVVDPGVSTDRWIRGLDYKAGDKRVVRAAFFSILETNHYIGGWTPWHTSVELPDGVAVRLPRQSHIAVDVLYKPTNEPVTDRPSLGLYFAKVPPPNAMTTLKMRSESTGRGNSGGAISAKLTVQSDVTLFELRPELAPGARSVEIKARRPDGSTQVLLWIKDFRQEWPTPYVLRRPAPLPAGSTIVANAYFDGVETGSHADQLAISLNVYAPTRAR